MAELLTPLQEYLLAAASRPFDWGDCDCALFAAGWVRIVRGVDPAADLRGTYSTRNGAYLLMRAEGGLLAVIERRMAAHGFTETQKPGAGDVGIVTAFQAAACAIKTRSGWACKTERGIVVRPFDVAKAWAL
jgi:hypothetical protein